MKHKHRFHHVWLILAAYGVWFALLSGVEEILEGKVWKTLLSVVLGVVVYVLIERHLHKDEYKKSITFLSPKLVAGRLVSPVVCICLP